MGYSQKTWEIDPRPWVQLAIRSAFHEILRRRSVGKAIRALNERGIRFPRRIGETGATESLLLDLYRNFAYTGAYEFGKTRTDPARIRTPGGQVRRLPVPREEREITEGHHEAYVSRDDWFEIQRILDGNIRKGSGRPAGRGPALLERRICVPSMSAREATVDCCWCTTAMHVRTVVAHRLIIARGIDSEASVPASVYQRQMDAAVRDAALARLKTPRLKALGEALDRARRDLATDHHLRRLQMNELERQLEQLRFRVTVVDATNTLVVQTLEGALREVTEKLERLKNGADRERREILEFDETALDRLLQIAHRLVDLFVAETTTNEERKEIIAALVDRVIVTERTAERIRLRILWIDDEPAQEVDILLPPYTHRKARELAAEGLRPCQVARRLNELGLVPSRGGLWRPGPVANMLRTVSKKKITSLTRRDIG